MLHTHTCFYNCRSLPHYYFLIFRVKPAWTKKVKKKEMIFKKKIQSMKTEMKAKMNPLILIPKMKNQKKLVLFLITIFILLLLFTLQIPLKHSQRVYSHILIFDTYCQCCLTLYDQHPSQTVFHFCFHFSQISNKSLKFGVATTDKI